MPGNHKSDFGDAVAISSFKSVIASFSDSDASLIGSSLGLGHGVGVVAHARPYLYYTHSHLRQMSWTSTSTSPSDDDAGRLSRRATSSCTN